MTGWSPMFSQSIPYYDKIYDFKDYQSEADHLLTIIRAYQQTEGRQLLDVACGTGGHIAYLKAHFDVQGMDVEADMVKLAREKHPDVTFHQGDMTAFDLHRQFDVITCLFSSIGYVKTVERLRQAIACMAAHLNAGGVLVIEPWFSPEQYFAGRVHARFINEPDLKIVRMNTSVVEGRVSVIDFHYLIGTPKGTAHFVEHHELGLFEPHETRQAFIDAGLKVTHLPEGLTDRGLFIGQKP